MTSFAKILQVIVAPYTGAWIEIREPFISSIAFCVAPYTGAWIEILIEIR